MAIKFLWETDDDELDAQIVEEWVLGNQGEFIQAVCGGNQMLLATITFEQKKAFAIRKLTEQNMNSVRQSSVERIMMAERNRIAQEHAESIGALPPLIVHPGALLKPTGKEMVTRTAPASIKSKRK